jgi:hypothetical protein
MQDQAHTSRTDSEQTLRSPLEHHAERQAALTAQKAAAERTSRTFSTLRLVSLLGAAAIAGVRGFGYLPSGAGYIALSMAAAFVALVVAHTRLHRRIDRIEATIAYHVLAMTRLSGAWSKCPSRGDRFVSEAHPYSSDLGVFGPASLFQMLDWTQTRLGEQILGTWLSGPAPIDTIRARQRSAKDLAARWRFREQLAVEGSLLAAERPDPEPLLKWAEAEPLLSGLAPRAAAYVVPPCVLVIIVAAAFDAVSMRLLLLALAAAWLVNFSFQGTIESVFAAVGPHAAALVRYRAMLELIEHEPFEAPLLEQLAAEVGHRSDSMPSDARDPAQPSSFRLRSLSRIAGFFDARNNEVFRFFLGPLVLWDVHCVLSLERWKRHAGRNARRWLEVIGEVEALSSLGTHAADHPDDAWPELTASPVFAAAALGHPLLAPEVCVRNDVELEGPGTALLVTGSNMSGKSTLLRAMGVNAVLALAGAPVRARSLTLCVFGVRASMTARDSLEQGVSFFYAEVQKLKRVLDGLRGDYPLLFLLDEILQGTNSRERSIGARTVLRHLVLHGAMGAVSTHDVNLWQLGPELEPHLRKVHFEEQVAPDGTDSPRMSFDYRLRPGIVQSSNALKLMKLAGIDLDFSTE